MKKTIIFAVLFFSIQWLSIGCPVCERNQPKALRGIVHGAGPDSQWDYISIWITIIIAVLTLFFSIKWLIKPGEKNVDHIKYSILK